MQESYAQAFEEGKQVVLYFRADWCSTCPPVETALAEIIPRYSDRLALVKIDVHQRPDLVEKHNILSVPTVLLCAADDRVLWRKSGFIRREDLVAALERR
jgi:thioredoxin-like negative regulator of GroEL